MPANNKILPHTALAAATAITTAAATVQHATAPISTDSTQTASLSLLALEGSPYKRRQVSCRSKLDLHRD